MARAFHLLRTVPHKHRAARVAKELAAAAVRSAPAAPAAQRSAFAAIRAEPQRLLTRGTNHGGEALEDFPWAGILWPSVPGRAATVSSARPRPVVAARPPPAVLGGRSVRPAGAASAVGVQDVSSRQEMRSTSSARTLEAVLACDAE
mmetsp:Transcript_71963/g.181550  ORF Transcript_71963/g.181550 Transcript_71963/m.181550 type:complete len:147 (-) Transcript_71963:164-604(-)|eukprot:CAMPEP_0115263700 /NCGR_PEP_ID=MMETSP0270-20121206/50049_1 /TAXON_ID=71861 /ORGANISM="Scrippsiella trochoidea, Strain CCMP3099" /LENGTH=146 /DNA_ID=CAMNT_0002679697 /DNA_START=94 /DNA_END=534 /DNA_ORIENTATION=-